MSLRPPLLLACLLTSLAMAGCATHTGAAPALVRYKIPGSNFPIANAVEVPAGAGTVYLSGKTATLKDKSKSPTEIAAYGDTETQTVSVLQAIDAQLKGMGLSMSDVVKMQAFLVKDPAKGGKMDFAGFMKGYSQFFGTATQPNLPSRSTLEVAALANPALLVEIEVMAVRGGQSVNR
ncbi:RidA family protein [Comamonas composti]|uniref:RidA family protein n=1 Tax=Comamonas composti TaxID=408558 RepID=UPI00047C290E|nr:RidA family protein [Comamonas composti]